MLVTASIVLYNSNEEELKKVINSVLSTSAAIKLYLIDNSPTDVLKFFSSSSKIEYIHNPSNPGFGAAHNLAIGKAMKMGAKHHFVVNPDIYFEGDIITSMINFMKKDSAIGMMMPEVLNENGTVQNLPKLLPSPWSILFRKLKWPKSIYQKFINNYELRLVPRKTVYNAPILSGCFTLLNLDAIEQVGLYDDSYFMYFEDWDLSRRMHQKYKTIYFPLVSVYHGYDSGANKNSKLFKIYLDSAKTYFSKWGWFFDKERKIMNKQTLGQFR